jgi:hypothetical protein
MAQQRDRTVAARYSGSKGEDFDSFPAAVSGVDPVGTSLAQGVRNKFPIPP